VTELLPIDNRVRPHKLTVEDYEILAANGALDRYARTELIDGSIYYMNAQHRPHGIVKMELYDALREALRRTASPLRPVVEFSLKLSPNDMPDPDLMVTSEPRGEGAVPLSSVALVIEVADTTLALDLGERKGLYAANAVPEYWVADVNGRTIHQHWRPVEGSYAENREVMFGKPLSAATIPQLTIETSALG
jgi:Uma2 family endonuclease